MVAGHGFMVAGRGDDGPRCGVQFWGGKFGNWVGGK